MDNLRQVECFVRAAELGSIAAAARKLGITPAAASQNIARLEKALGTRLMRRTTRALALTESGRVYLERVAPLLDALERAGEAVLAINARPQGPLKIACSVAFGRYVIAGLLPRFLAAYPEISVELALGDIVVDHLSDDVDISIRFQNQLEPGLISRKLLSVPLYIVAAPAYLARAGTPPTPEALKEHDCLAFRFARDGRLLPWGFIRDGARFEPPLRPKIIANDIDTLATLALSGMGITRLGAFIADPLLAQGRLVSLFERPADKARQAAGSQLSFADPEPLDIYVCVVDRLAETPKIRAFIDFAVAALKGPWPPASFTPRDWRA
ncbi:LysR family transcriptional regulator [Xaviernesmea oryzae]|uniref:HTH-type transcriptional regulator TtuA n=1 Tax=Xaviernesmea oryzae TaxID=464029 RepID=A0A1Q9B1H5_9HYPH|nr:LysR family transcriptional regulator [Xaviernesmea oryzae]OLP61840.1 LysR family transcriptional regulator [Xaviernesmea oryzae]SEL75831.1 DNA-binding transcriptional regulator, LysR family [Xaviernesmea oryzae]